MTDDDKKQYRLSVRMEQEDFEKLEHLRSILRKRKGRSVRVTQRTVIIEALNSLEKSLNELERKR